MNTNSSAAFDESESSPIPLSAVIKGEPIAQASLDSGLYESRWQRARPLEREYMRAMASLEKACAARRRSRNDWDGRLRMSYGSEKASSIPGWHIRQNVGSWHSPFPAWVISFAEPHRRRNRPMTTECFASMFVRQVRQCFSVVWADGFPRCRHRFPVM